MATCDVELEDGSLCDFEPPAGSQPNALGHHRWSKHGVRAGAPLVAVPREPAPDVRPDGAEPGSVFAPQPGPSGETPPVRGGADRSAGGSPPVRRGLLGRFKRKPKDPAAVTPSREKVPKPPRRGRLSGAETLGNVGDFIAGALQHTGHVPTGRLVSFQAPAAGELLDELAKGTIVDRPLQYVVRSRTALDTLFALFAPAKFTWDMEKAMMANDEAAFRRAEAGLKWAVREALPTMIPAMKKVREREAKKAAALVDLLDMADLEMLGVTVNEDGQPVSNATGQVVDIGDIFAAMLFAEWVPQAHPQAAPPEEDPARV